MSVSTSVLALQWWPEVFTHPTLDAQMLELEPLEVDAAASTADFPPRRLRWSTAVANRFQGGRSFWRLPRRWLGSCGEREGCIFFLVLSVLSQPCPCSAARVRGRQFAGMFLAVQD